MDADGHTDGRTVELPADEAADRLGISKDALRKRISRGTIDARKVDGVWMVTIAPGGAGRTRPRTDTDDETVQPSVRPRKEGIDNALIARLESENDFLRQQVERQNHIIAGLIQRVPLTHEIGAGEIITVDQESAEGGESAEFTDATVAANLGPLRDETSSRALETLDEPPWPPKPTSDSMALRWRRWWRRVMGGG
jgi:hypothetical protein